MVTQDMLVVLVMGDPGRRALLAARLSLAGHPLVTAGALSGDLLDSLFVRHPAALVVDEADIPGDVDAWIARIHDDTRWFQLAIMSAGADGTKHHPWGARVAHRAVLEDVLAHWRDTVPPISTNP